MKKYFTDLQKVPAALEEKIAEYIKNKSTSSRELPLLFSRIVGLSVENDNRLWFKSNFACFIGEIDDIKRTLSLSEKDELFFQTEKMLLQIGELLTHAPIAEPKQINNQQPENYLTVFNSFKSHFKWLGTSLAGCLCYVALWYQENLHNKAIDKLIENYNSLPAISNISNVKDVSCIAYDSLYSNFFSSNKALLGLAVVATASVYFGTQTFFKAKKVNDHITKVDELLKTENAIYDKYLKLTP